MTPLQAKSVCHQLRFTHVVGRGWKQDANAFFDNLHRYFGIPRSSKQCWITGDTLKVGSKTIKGIYRLDTE